MATVYTPAQFDKAVELIGKLPEAGPVKPTQDDKLTFYGLFKQANVGDNDTKKPGMMDFAGKYKWEAWNKNKGLSTDEAKHKYVEHFIAVLDRAGSPEAEDLKKQVLAA
ncbi:uncharacterized protein JCM10292_004917 [Rhodotorula paludigena]|uniref:uncharacterized protein n=1 Tax=Rhodotorula paludigena TaxID=86838 RepID=UPI00317C2171